VNDKRKQVQLLALENIATHSMNPQSHKVLKNTKLIRYLSKLIGETDLKLLQALLPILINLSEDPFFLKQMISQNVVSRVVDAILDSKNVPKLYVVLLCNITREERGARKLLQIGDTLMGYYVTKLVQIFCENDPNKDKNDEYQWIGSILINITQIKEGRELMLDKSRHLLENVVKFVSHPNLIRRRGILGTIRNILFDKNSHTYLMNELDILPILLNPIRGPEEFSTEELEGMPDSIKYVPHDKSRDEDFECRALAVDCLLLLTSTLKGREVLREKKVYEIIREYDKVEKDELITERIYSIVTLLKGLDEPNEEVNINPIDVISGRNDDIFEKMKEELLPKTEGEEILITKTKQKEEPVEFDELGEVIEII